MEKVQSTTQPPRFEKPVRITEQVWPEGTVPIVSVFNWVYNHAEFIRESIDSILMQETTFPVEIIIHDDASTDGTTEIIREYEAKYPQLFRNILQTENQWSQGKSVMDPMFTAPRGEFIALAHGDDYWASPRKLQKQLTLLESNSDCSLVFHDVYVKEGKAYNPDEPGQRMLQGVNQEKFFLKDVLRPWFIPTASIVYRKNCIPDIPAWLANCQCGDIPLQLLCATKGYFLFIKEAMSVYRKHESGVSTQLSGVNVIAGRAYIYESFNIHTNRLYEKELRRALEMEIRLHTPELYALDRRRPAAWRLFAVSIRRKVLSLLRSLGIGPQP